MSNRHFNFVLRELDHYSNDASLSDESRQWFKRMARQIRLAKAIDAQTIADLQAQLGNADIRRAAFLGDLMGSPADD